MTLKKLLTVTLVMVFLLGSMGGVLGASDDYKDAPAVANELLREAGVRPNSAPEGNYIRMVAHEMCDNTNDFWDIPKHNEDAYRQAIKTFLISKGLIFEGWIFEGEPVLWLDAVEYDEDTGTWTDKSGHINHATQTNSNKKPVFVANILKSNPVVRFDGQYDYLDVPTSLGIFANATGGTIIVVAAPTESSAVETLIGWSKGDHGLIYRYTVGKTDDDKWRTGGRRLDGDSFQTIAGGTIETGAFDLVSSVVSWENADLRLFENGNVVASTNTFQDQGNTSETDSQGMAIGARPDGNGNNWNGDIAEILIYDRELSDDERKMVEEYLSAKYGL